MTPPSYGPKVRIATVHQRTSARGNPYMSGLLGPTNIVLMRDPARDNEWGLAWAVYLEQRPEKPAAATHGRQVSRPKPSAATPRPQRAPERPAPDDPLDDVLPAGVEGSRF